MSATEELANFLVETSYEAMHPEAIKVAKEAMLDCLGTLLAGSKEPTAKVLISFLKSLRGEPQAGVIGWGFKTSVPNAALANGTMAHVLDYDDVSVMGHPTTTLLPALLVLGEKVKASGKDIIEAYILGFEVATRCAEAVGLGPRRLEFHPTAIMGTIGAGAAAAKLLRLDVEKTRMTLGLAASHACGMGENRGTMTKSFHAGNAARGGVVAAMLINEGYTAIPDIMETPFGFIHAFSASEECDIKKLTENLGKTFKVVSPGITIKKYPTCSVTHSAIDAMLHLIKDYSISPEEVESVEVEVIPIAMNILTYTDPINSLQGKFSMNFTLAVALQEHNVGLKQVTDEKVNHPKIKELMKKIKMIPRTEEPEVSPESIGIVESPTTVRVRFLDGKECSHRVAKPRGSPDNPLSWEELSAKYRECSGLVLKGEEIERSLKIMENLEELRDISELVEAVKGKEG